MKLRPLLSTCLALAALCAGPAAASRAGAPDHAPAVTLDPLPLEARGTGQQFGYVVSPAGDFDGDGFPDWLITAPVDDGDGLDVGVAYLYRGGPAIDDLPDWTFHGEAPGDKFGECAAALGDFDGDGYDDVAIGADGHDAAGANSGRVYVYFGGPAADTLADLRMTGEAAADYFGFWCAAAGDLNADGWPDLAVGAPLNDRTGSNAGAAFVYFGGPGADSLADLVLPGRAADDEFGRGLAGLGDFDGDGDDDLAVGAPFNDLAGANAGEVWIFLGGADVDSLPDRLLYGEAPGDFFGWPIAATGDANGDGVADVAVAAWGNDARGADAGTVRVFPGGPLPDAVAFLTLRGAAAGDRFGYGLGGGDLNDDGIGDVLVGAPGSDVTVVDGGRALVYFGGVTPDTLADEDPVSYGENFGNAIARVGDLRGDGFPDLLVGAWHAGIGGPLSGRAVLFDVDRYRFFTPISLVPEDPHRVHWAGAEPANVRLSLDGGRRWSTVATGVGGQPLNTFVLSPDHPPTSRARVAIEPADPAVSGAIESGDFTLEGAARRLSVWPSPARRADVVQIVFGTAAAVLDLVVEVYDIRGRLVDRIRPAGRLYGVAQVAWEPARAGARPGVYFVRATADGVEQTGRLVILD